MTILQMGIFGLGRGQSHKFATGSQAKCRGGIAGLWTSHCIAFGLRHTFRKIDYGKRNDHRNRLRWTHRSHLHGQGQSEPTGAHRNHAYRRSADDYKYCGKFPWIP